MAEQLIRNEQVGGSIPFTSSKKHKAPPPAGFCGSSAQVPRESNPRGQRRQRVSPVGVIGQKVLIKTAVAIEISMAMAVLSCF